MIPQEIDELAAKLVDRMIFRNRIPEDLRTVANSYMRVELVRMIRRTTRSVTRNAESLLLLRRLLWSPSGQTTKSSKH